MNKTRIWPLLLSGLLLVGSAAQADSLTPSIRNAPISVNADNQEVDIQHNQVIFSGNVLITQDNLELHAQSVTISNMQNSDQQKITAKGKPVRFTQKLNNGQTIKGFANQVHYDVKQGKLTLNGQAKVTNRDNLISSDQIVYLVDQQKITASSQSSKSRVKTVIVPQQVQEFKH